MAADTTLALLGSPTPRRRGRERQRTERRSIAPTLVAGASIAGLAFVLRLIQLRDSYNIFIDETTYAAIAASVGAGTGVTLHGEPFILHPPLGFLILGAAGGPVGTESPAAHIFALRPVVAVFGALVVFLLTALLWRIGLPRAALSVGALLALDPFAISFDSRVMLEALAQLFAAATVIGAVIAARNPDRHFWRWSILTGVAGAATFATKETFGLVISLTLLIAAAAAPPAVRRRMLLALGGTAVGYGLANLVVIQQVGLGPWWESRSSGLARLIGTAKPTGFTGADSQVSLWSRIGPNAAEYGVTYLLLVVGGLSGAVLLVLAVRRARMLATLTPAHRAVVLVVGAWTVAACAYVAYAVLFGSIEEQMFYIAVAPCVTSLVVLAELSIRAANPRRASAAVGVLIALLAAQSVVWAQVHTTPDDAQESLLDWLPEHVAADSRIAVTEETAQFLIQAQELGEWDTVAELRQQRVDYVLLSPTLVTQGYGRATSAFATQVAGAGDLVFSFTGRKSDLRLYDVRNFTGGSR